MAVEVDDTDWPVIAVDGTEQRESDGVVTSKSDQARQCSSLLGRSRFLSMGVRCAAQQEVMAFLNLLERKGVIVSVVTSVLFFVATVHPQHSRSNWNISTVDDLGPRVERVCLQWDVVSATKSNPA